MKIKKYPLLSIIIPVYNTGIFLERCLNSVINQTYKNLEIIIVNDGSTDNSDEIIRRYQDLDHRITYVNNSENTGLFQARLRGYEKAGGTYIASLDSDDFVGADYYRMLMSAAILSNSDIVISNMTTHYQNSGERYQRTYGNYAVRDLDLSGEGILNAYFEMDAEVSQWWFVWNKVYAKDLWDQCYAVLSRYQGHHIMLEDFIFGTVFMANAKHIVSIPCDCYYYVRHDAASTGSAGGAEKIKKNVWDIVDALKFIDTYFTDIDIGEKGIAFLNKACSRWKRTWLYSVKGAAITDSQKYEIIHKLEEIQTECETNQFEDKWKGYFYRELNPYNNKLNEIKENILQENIKLVCIEIPDTLLGNVFGPDTFLKILSLEWQQKFHEDIFEIIQMRKKSEHFLKHENKDEAAEIWPSVQQIYENIKLIFPENIDLIEKVKNFEMEIMMKYTFLRNDICELQDYCQWTGKPFVLLNDSIYRIKAADICKNQTHSNIYHLQDYKESIFDVLCADFKCSPDETIFIGGSARMPLKKLAAQNIKIYEIEPVNVLAKNNYIFEKRTAAIAEDVIEAGNSCKEEINGIAAIRNLLQFENPFLSKVKNAVFNSDPYVIGMAAAGPHIMSVLGWLANISRLEHSKHLCFLGNNSKLYDYCLKFVQSESCLLNDLETMQITYSTEELILGWVLWPEDFDETYSKKLAIRISDLLSFLRTKEIDTDHLKKALFKYGMTEDMNIDTYTMCSMLHVCFENELSSIASVKNLFKAKNILPSNCIVFNIEYENVELSLLRRFNPKETIFTKLFPDESEADLGSYTYYKKKKVIDYPVRTYFYSRVFSGSKCSSYGERFLISNMEKGIQKYLQVYTDYFKDIFYKLLPCYRAEDSASFERFILFPATNDRLLFDSVEWLDYERNSRPLRLLSNVWWDKLNENNLLSKPENRDSGGKAVTKTVTKTVKQPLNIYSTYYKGSEYPLDQISKLERIFLYWIFDKDRINYKAHKYAASRALLLPLLCMLGKQIKPQKDCLYIATSNYNLLCCLVHKFMYNTDKECDLALSIWRKDKAEALKAEKIFKNIYLMNDNHFRNMTWALDKEIKDASKKRTDYLVEGFYDKLYEELPFRILEYKEIVATNTIMPVTVLLQKLHLSYDCMEEAAGLYSNNELLMNNMQSFHPKSEIYALDKYKMFNMNHVKGKRFVNVNAQEKNYSKKNVVDFNVISNLKSFDQPTRGKVLRVFSANEALKGEDKTTCLVLTYPLSTRSGLTETEHIEVYRLIMDIFCEDKMVHFKPHPDDKVIYSKYFDHEPDFRLINKQILSELLEFETKTNYLKAITTVSTSTNNLQNSKYKIVFGKEFEAGYKKLLPYFGYYAFLEKICPPEKYTVISANMYTEMLSNIFQYRNNSPSGITVHDGGLKPEDKNSTKIAFLSKASDLKWDCFGSGDIAIIENSCTLQPPAPIMHRVFPLVLRAEKTNEKQEYAFTAILPAAISPFRGDLGTLLRTGFKITIE